MVKKAILVTDNFLSKENEETIYAAGFELCRLPVHCAAQDELIEALKGKSGYILGGIETVTAAVIKSVDSLQAIVYNSTNYQVYIPACDKATKRGIAIANCPGADSTATAEYALTLMLAMARNIFDIGRTGKATEFIGRSLDELRVGIIGLGNIGTSFAHLLKNLGIQNVYYYSRTRHAAEETELGIQYVSKEDLLSSCNVVSIHTHRSAGEVVSSEELAQIQDGGIVINVSYPEAVNSASLIREIKKGRLRAAYDFPPNDVLEEARSVSPGQFFWANEYAGYNTSSALRLSGDMATASIINLLTTGMDTHLVNPDYLNYRTNEEAAS
ncbi:MAG TPA: NAD(P)-dependent oxidoreductase [Candidatus Bathyarchaeia archaeon]|nr:NAD(P)-dependent oxidoreductase [Candidatus Bathyarchaeia archaeon]